eukprot:scaffold12950_cov22-Tisochrysis_lutea.AAC.1
MEYMQKSDCAPEVFPPLSTSPSYRPFKCRCCLLAIAATLLLSAQAGCEPPPSQRTKCRCCLKQIAATLLLSAKSAR